MQGLHPVDIAVIVLYLVGNVIKRLCTAAWALTAIAAVAWYIQQGVDPSTIDPDFVYANVAQAFLPKAAPGLLRVFLAFVWW